MDGGRMKVKTRIEELTLEDVTEAGVGMGEAQVVLQKVKGIVKETCGSAAHTWHRLSKEVLLPSSLHPFPLHQLLFYSTFLHWDSARLGPPPAWMPSLESARFTNIGQVLERLGKELLGSVYTDPISSFSRFYELSVQKPEVYWRFVLDELNISFNSEPRCILDTEEVELHPGGKWLPDATYNAAECCLKAHRRKKEDDYAIVWRDEGSDDAPLNYLTYGELHAKAFQVANALSNLGFVKGDPIAIDMPMNVYAIVIYLGIVLAGCVVVSIADSFAASEIQTRLRLTEAKAIFTQDVIIRGSKSIPLYVRVIEAGAPKAIVYPSNGDELNVTLRDGDLSWDQFLEPSTNISRLDEFKVVIQPMEAMSNILFSSGTTGEPKVIPWTHLTPIKVAADAWAHHDIKAGDVVAWPTNLGWMMGPWLIYATFFNNACMALYNGSPIGTGFVKFVQAREGLNGRDIEHKDEHWDEHYDLPDAEIHVEPEEESILEKKKPEMLLTFKISINPETETFLETMVERDDTGRRCVYFLQDARVTVLGLVPSIAKSWKHNDSVNGFDWSRIRCFSSSGEASNEDDYLWLMGRAGYKPVIEYCGGTEIGGAFITGSMLQPQALSAFSTPALGCAIFILDETSKPHPPGQPAIGEVALDPVFLGASSKLLNADHFEIYFKGMPRYEGKRLRRHGDELECTAGGFYRAHGRVDDTMNLGGIKVSSVEIERLCNVADGRVLETAAIGVPPAGGGPEMLTLVVVLKSNDEINIEELKRCFNLSIQQKLNPLFKVNNVVLAPSLPRTASNKVMRRMLRGELGSFRKRRGEISLL